MEIIRHRLESCDPSLPTVSLQVERPILAKRRWRGLAEDGQEFGFELQQPLSDQDTVFQTDGKRYVVSQKPEPVIEAEVSVSDLAARIGWLVGNLHLPMMVLPGLLRVPDAPAARRLFENEGVAFQARMEVFVPLAPAHSHE